MPPFVVPAMLFTIAIFGQPGPFFLTQALADHRRIRRAEASRGPRPAAAARTGPTYPARAVSKMWPIFAAFTSR